MTPSKPSPLLALPNEIIYQILGHLGPLALVDLSVTCRSLRSYSENDLLWASFVYESLPIRPTSPSPCRTWKELYISYYPYWFLPRHKLWFADRATVGSVLTGQLVIARYDPRLGCIEAYRIVAEANDRGQSSVRPWEYDPRVMIHVFNPKVGLFLDNPVIKLNMGDLPASRRLHQELLMQRQAAASINGVQRIDGIRSMLFLTRSIPPELQDSKMSLWPPKIFPAVNRVRNVSPSMFKGEGHKPQHFDQICQTNFRLRKWTEFRSQGRSSVRMGEDVMTFSTLPADCYTPTEAKPYQGIWVGDYAGHGCEWLLLVQKVGQEAGLAQSNHRLPQDPPSPSSTITHRDEDISLDKADEDLTIMIPESPPGSRGRLEAIKLTGDPHVPRGEYTWIAEDIGEAGLIRVAEEKTFNGARIVQSWSHVADRDFEDGKKP
ncbi:hypothetical protein MMC13_000540 [Lambiella insularis]|nr:hypothetical protein [Lambiella insularis]